MVDRRRGRDRIEEMRGYLLIILYIGLLYGGVCKEVRSGVYVFSFDYPYPGEEVTTVYFGSKEELSRWVYDQLAPFAPPDKPGFLKRVISFLSGGLVFKSPTFSDTLYLRLKLNPQLAAQRALDLWAAIEVIPPDEKVHKGFLNALFNADKIDTLPILYKKLIEKRSSYLLWFVLQDVSLECVRLAKISYREYESLYHSSATLKQRWEKLNRARKMAQLALLLYSQNLEAKKLLRKIGERPK